MVRSFPTAPPCAWADRGMSQSHGAVAGRHAGPHPALPGTIAPAPPPAPLAICAGLAEALAAGPGGSADASEPWGQASAAGAGVLDHLAAHAGQGHDLRPGDFRDLVYGELQGQAVRRDAAAHPLVCFRRSREAGPRAWAMPPGLVICRAEWGRLARAAAAPDPWLSRPMRLARADPAERRVGLAAHDFQQAWGGAGGADPRPPRCRGRDHPVALAEPAGEPLGGCPDQPGSAGAGADIRARGRRWLDLPRLQAQPLDGSRLRAAPRPSRPRRRCATCR